MTIGSLNIGLSTIKSFHYSALKDWNNTPNDIRELLTINTFKRQLKLFMKSKTNKHDPLEDQLQAK